jgi:hypothetical protein
MYLTTDAEGAVTGVKPMPAYTGDRVAGLYSRPSSVFKEILQDLQRQVVLVLLRTGLGMGSGLGYGTAGAGLTRALGYTPRGISTGTFSPAAASYYMSPYATNVSDIAARELRRQGDITKSQGAMGAIGTRFIWWRASSSYCKRNKNVDYNKILLMSTLKANKQRLKTRKRFMVKTLHVVYKHNKQIEQAEQAAAQLAGQTGVSGLQAGLEASRAQSANAAATQTANLERLKTQAASEQEKQALQQKIN